MKSLDTLLSEAVSKMKDSTKAKYSAQTDGKKLPQETLVSIAESLLAADGEVAKRITRNNGGTRQPSVEESRESVMQECDRVLFEGMEKVRSNAAGLSQLVEVGGRFLTIEKGREVKESDREDYAFCRRIGLSHEDAVKVIREGGVR